MTTVTMRAAAVLISLGVLATPLHAQSPAAEPLRLALDDAIARGLANSHRIAEAVARGEAAEAVIGERHAAALPQIATLAGYTRTNHVETFGILLPNNQLKIIYPDIPDNYRARLDVQWPIYTAGRTDALEQAARAESAAARDDVEAARADLRLEITRAYWALATATESLRVVGESLVRIEAHLRDVRNQFGAGLVPPNDVSSVEAQESRQRMLNIQARSTRDVAEADLARLIGVPIGTSIDPTATFDLPQVRSDAEFASLVDAARRSRPERTALTKHATAAEERRTAAAAGRRPTISAGGGVDYARPNPRIFPRLEAWRESWDASLNLTWPIFDGGRTASEMSEAAALARAAAARLAEFDDTLALEVRQRLSELESSRAAIEAATDAVRAATEARRVVGDRFGAGVATSTDVLDAQVALLQAELDRTQAIANARLADARLARALGR